MRGRQHESEKFEEQILAEAASLRKCHRAEGELQSLRAEKKLLKEQAESLFIRAEKEHSALEES